MKHSVGRPLTLVLGLGGALLLALPAAAQPGPGGGGRGMGPGRGMGRGRGMGPGMGMGPGHGPPLQVIAKAVGLSDKQVKEIRSASFAAQREAIGVRAKVQMARLELHQLMSGDTAPKEAQVMALVDKVGKFETQMKKIHVRRLLSIRRALSLAQWRKLEAFRAQHRGPRGRGGRGGQGWGRGRRHRGGPPAP